ncbi:MAG: ParB/RepB/Spo0J family partition protein [Gemmatimonadetes bacterium]|nr:ParB/RepB/Spo0J family partition protein [Gemmatimonadota bacterium]
MQKRDRLGRGLGALLGEYLGEPSSDGAAVRLIPVSAIMPNPFQPRREIPEAELEELAASIRENGLLQPVVVRSAPASSAGAWELVAGERRWRATMRLGWREIPALVREVDDRTLLVLALVENLQRAELGPLEEAVAYRRLVEDFGLSQQQVAQLIGRDRSTIANALRLLQLPAAVQQLLVEGKLSAGHARALLGVASDRRMVELARRAAERGWSVREVELQVQRARVAPAGQAGKGERPRDAAERRLEEELQRALGTAVRLRRVRGQRGRIEIPFYSAEDFERLYELLVGRPAAEVVS